MIFRYRKFVVLCLLLILMKINTNNSSLNFMLSQVSIWKICIGTTMLSAKIQKKKMNKCNNSSNNEVAVVNIKYFV